MPGPLASRGGRGGRNKTVGKLRERVRIERLSVNPSRDAAGAEIEAWETVDTVWASVEATGGTEFFASGQVQANATHKVTVRHRDDVTPKNRLIWVTNGDKVLNVESVNESVGGGSSGNSLEIMCVREV